jgi:hypothetical protein
MRTVRSFRVLIATMVVSVSCRGILGPSCTDESGDVLKSEGVARMSETSAHTVVSPKSSNLLIRLTWADTQATLAVSATIIDLRRAHGVPNGDDHTATGSRWSLSHPTTLATRGPRNAGRRLAG